MTLCFDIGGSAIKSAVMAHPGAVARPNRVATPLHDFEAFVAALSTSIERAEPDPAAGIAVAITGVIDPDTNIIKCANIPCIDGRALADELQARLKRPVLVANDADCFALAEAGVGAGRGHRIVFGAILGTGVGGALVIDGKVLNGAGGIAGEWGHGPAAANFAGPNRDPIPSYACGCGQSGCVDTIGAARGMERLHLHLHQTSLSSTDIVEQWQAGAAEASHTIDCYVDLVASPLALVINIVGASIVPVGGGLSNSPSLIARLDLAVRQRILRQTTQPLVVPSQCRVEPGLIGASILAQTELHQ